jgi:hypothetical protein
MTRPGGWKVGRLEGAGVASIVLSLSVLPTFDLSAQDSQYGIRSLGTPGRWESVRARSTGGAFGPFDALSPLTEAPLADVGHLAASAMAGASYRDVDAGGATSALRATRFPLLILAGQPTRRLALAGGFTTYLDRTWSVTIRDSAVLRDSLQRYTDLTRSDGSVADLRFAAASRLSSRIALGAAVHLLAGSTRITVQRRFDDTTYQVVSQSDVVRYAGFGVSASALVGLAPGLTLAAWARSDNRLRAKVGEVTTAETDLPTMAGGGIRYAPSPSVRLAASGAWRSWSRAGAGSFDTFSWSVGAEVGGGLSPVRFGARGGQMPFGPGTTAPTEIAVAAGTSRAFSQGRGLLDLGLERLQRTGGGLTERVWTVLIGMTIRP